MRLVSGKSVAALSLLRIMHLLWKEFFEIFQRPMVGISLLLLSVFVVWAAGKLAIERPPIRAFLYGSGPGLEEARAVLREYAPLLTFTERDDSIVRPDDMQRAGVSFAIVRRDGAWMVPFAIPLTFSAKPLEYWLFFGTDAFGFHREVACLVGQCVFVVGLLSVGTSLARSRL